MTQQKCPTIIGLTFDEEGQEAIDFINSMDKKIKEGWFLQTIGQLALIFGGMSVKAAPASNFIERSMTAKVITSDAGSVGYNITQTNWEYFFKAYSGLALHGNAQVEKVIFLQALRGDISPKERLFWRAMYQGCKVK